MDESLENQSADAILKEKLRLKKHREKLRDNPTAYTQDMERKSVTLVSLLKKSGYNKMDKNNPRCLQLAYDITMAIFEAQGCKPYFHIDSDLPYCWNVPAKWNLNYIYYEWGHMKSRHNHEKKADDIKNLCLQSQRCNQHIQSGLDTEDLKIYGGKLAEIIDKNEASFKKFYASPKWVKLEERLFEFKSRPYIKKSDIKVGAGIL
ncbi:hypothetical protein [Erwinia oleae]|uniref:hypothetical protein n=1 Tax=Erwinia oleae TaxID=796334 RepID=UPI000556684B|nr:hypothetical protein [Erwinia oleae]